MDRPSWCVREQRTGLDVALHVQVRARSSSIAGLHGSALKIRIAAPPVDNAANEAIVSFFSSLLSIPKSRMQIVSGQKSRDKILRIDGLSLEGFLAVPNIRKVSSPVCESRH